jgi:hypothetical protein
VVVVLGGVPGDVVVVVPDPGELTLDTGAL